MSDNYSRHRRWLCEDGCRYCREETEADEQQRNPMSDSRTGNERSLKACPDPKCQGHVEMVGQCRGCGTFVDVPTDTRAAPTPEMSTTTNPADISSLTPADVESAGHLTPEQQSELQDVMNRKNRPIIPTPAELARDPEVRRAVIESLAEGFDERTDGGDEPDLISLRGVAPDITGGMASEDYVKTLRCIRELAREMAEEMNPLPPDTARILYEELWDLYEGTQTEGGTTEEEKP